MDHDKDAPARVCPDGHESFFIRIRILNRQGLVVVQYLGCVHKVHPVFP